jgi:Ca-activated chloride channel family protein
MQADYVLDYDVIAASREHHLFLAARIQGGPPPESFQRRPLNLSVVLDRSGSMSGDKIDYVKKAAKILVQHLGAKDRFSLVAYDDVVTVEVAPDAPTHKDPINRAIDALTARNSTNLSGGWLQGCQLVAEGKADGQVNRVLLLTDGLANQGITDPRRLASMARQKREEGVTTTAMGVGMDFNEDLLREMASEGGGAFYFIDNPDRAPSIFAEELQDLMSVVGQNLVITLALTGEDVRMVRQLNTYPSEAAGREITFRLGDLFADEVKALLLELFIPALKTLGRVEVARLRFEYDEMGEETATHRVIELPIFVNAVSDEESAGAEPNPEVVKPALLLKAARAREEAIRHADQGDYGKAQTVLKEAADDIQVAGLADRDLQTEHNMLREEAVDMEFGPQRYDAHTRKAQTTKAYTSERYMRFAAEKAGQHASMKAARQAIERGGGTPTTVRWDGEARDLAGIDRLTIGRAADNDVMLMEDEVSAHHCQIAREGDNLFLEDVGSKNGTYANGGRVTGRFRLSAGDVVTVGATLFEFK